MPLKNLPSAPAMILKKSWRYPAFFSEVRPIVLKISEAFLLRADDRRSRHVRNWPKADISSCNAHVCFWG
jgi:hypothetical protein